MKFYFDFISHNAYLAWFAAQKLLARHGTELQPVPVLFAGFLNHYGTKGPAEVPPKSRWMLKNVLRKAAQENLALAPPHSHPFIPLLALRTVLAVANRADRCRLVDRIFLATWAESADITQADVIQALIADCGLDPAVVLAAASSAEVKAQLRSNTEQAIAAGVFGVPTMVLDEELFFGYDDLVFVDQHLSGQGTLSAGALDGWEKIQPSAQR